MEKRLSGEMKLPDASPFGDGKAAQRIVNVVNKHFIT
jgi:UDP-N-acetylglucosamine 2-epimerase